MYQACNSSLCIRKTGLLILNKRSSPAGLQFNFLVARKNFLVAPGLRAMDLSDTGLWVYGSHFSYTSKSYHFEKVGNSDLFLWAVAYRLLLKGRFGCLKQILLFKNSPDINKEDIFPEKRKLPCNFDF